MRLLKELYKIYSPSGNEKRMSKFITNYIQRNIPEAKMEFDKIGNIYITKGESETYPSIIAHLDQVQEAHSKDFVAIETKDIIFGYSPKNKRQEGLGADDKNGIWTALRCLEKYDVLKILLFVQEEVGCVGSRVADLKFFDDCRFVIGVDRRGHSDIITSICGLSLCSNEFLTDTEAVKFGYKENNGFITDVGELKERELPISCINLSCGYYEPHTDNEITVKKDLLNCLAFAQHIIENCTKVYSHVDTDSWDYDDIEFANTQQSIERDELTYLAGELLDANLALTTDEFYNMYCTYYPEFGINIFEQILKELKQQLNHFSRIKKNNKPKKRDVFTL